jgi:hypothetical protein
MRNICWLADCGLHPDSGAKAEIAELRIWANSRQST